MGVVLGVLLTSQEILNFTSFNTGGFLLYIDIRGEMIYVRISPTYYFLLYISKD